jgi:lipoate-protein ligase A
VDELRERILERIFGTSDRARIPSVALDADDWDAVRALRDKKYGAWSWNYGENPASNIQRARRFPVGEIDARLDVQQGLIRSVRIFGDFFGRSDVSGIESRLAGVPYEREAIARALQSENLADYFGDVAREDVLDLLCP